MLKGPWKQNFANIHEKFFFSHIKLEWWTIEKQDWDLCHEHISVVKNKVHREFKLCVMHLDIII